MAPQTFSVRISTPITAASERAAFTTGFGVTTDADAVIFYGLAAERAVA